MTAQLYEIRDESTGRTVQADMTADQVAQYFHENQVTILRDQKIAGVIVVFIDSRVHA